nr:hypothetical protein [Rhodococcus sp. (in: high G+C Gram-positive bacteria)]
MKLAPGMIVRLHKRGIKWEVVGWKPKTSQVHLSRYDFASGATISQWVDVASIRDAAV